MALLTEEKANIVKKFKRNEGDTGSPEVQIALLTENINIFRPQKRECPDQILPRKHSFIASSVTNVLAEMRMVS